MGSSARGVLIMALGGSFPTMRQLHLGLAVIEGPTARDHTCYTSVMADASAQAKT
jgi:hypothetical protein